jgi:hypothetical protein
MTAIQTHNLINNRDVGQIVGRDINESMLTQAPTSSLDLKIIWTPRRSPPFSKNQWVQDGNNLKQWREPQFSIPFVNPAKLDWDKIKFAAGGANGYQTGRYRCYGYLGWPSKGIPGRKVEISGATQAIARQMLESLSTLSEAELHGVGYSERARSTDPDDAALSEQFAAVIVYPKTCYISSQKRELDIERGRGTLTGNWSRRRERLELWVSSPDQGVNEIIADLKRWHTPLNI